jgi:hypothetical protein
MLIWTPGLSNLGEVKIANACYRCWLLTICKTQLVCSEFEQYDHYVALSYCWGGPQPLMALESNVQSLFSGFPDMRLPQILTDAVIVTR